MQLQAAKVAAIDSFLAFSEGGELPSYPLEVMVEISNLCDLQCAMCVTFSALNANRLRNIQSAERKLVSLKTLESLDTQFRHALVVHAFGYGEPTIHPQFRDILALLGRYEVMVDFFTNGMHLTEKVCRDLIDNRVLRLTVSFSGSTKEHYENMYLKGDFDRVLDGIRRLDRMKKEAGSAYPRIDINSIGFKHHVDNLPAFVRMMADAGANHIFLKPLTLFDVIPELDDLIALYRPHVEGKILDEAEALAKELGIGLSTGPFRRSPIHNDEEEAAYLRARKTAVARSQSRTTTEAVSIENLKKLASEIDLHVPFRDVEARQIQTSPPKDYRHFDMAEPCLEPMKTLHIKADGRIWPCCFVSKNTASLGNAFELGPDAWDSEPRREMQANVLKNLYPDMCYGCIKKNSAPGHHNVDKLVSTYARWFYHSFGTRFASQTVRRAVNLKSNATIAAAFAQGQEAAIPSSEALPVRLLERREPSRGP